MKTNRLHFNRFVGTSVCAVLLAVLFQTAAGQEASYSHKAQKALIPADLGPVYIGMPLKDFAKVIDISEAKADTRFDFINLAIPFKEGVIDGLTIRAHGFTREQIDEMTKTVEEEVETETGSYTRKVQYVDTSKIPADGFVYAFYIGFKPDFDLKSWAIGAFGSDGEVRKPDDEFYFYDIQWTKKTSDGLTWLIRSFHEDGRSLQLLGRISGTEWGID